MLFTGRKDDGLLKFMAERTSRSDRDDCGQATAALEARYEAIEQMKRRATDRQVCFRKAIVRYVGEEVSSDGRTMATRIVAWRFERRTKQQVASHCCDRCDRVGAGNVVEWTARVWTPWLARGLQLAWHSIDIYRERMELLRRIAIDPEVRFGRACVRGTRVTVGEVRGRSRQAVPSQRYS